MSRSRVGDGGAVASPRSWRVRAPALYRNAEPGRTGLRSRIAVGVARTQMFPLADTAKERGPAPMTMLIIAANVAVFSWEAWLALNAPARTLAHFVGDHALVARRIVAHPGSG